MDPRPGVPLAELTTLRLGGPSRALVEPATTDELVDVVRTLDRAGEPVLLVGGGSNLVVADEGFRGTVVRLTTTGVRERDAGGGAVELTVAAGEPWDDVVARTVDEGLGGLEAMSGIPGASGATPVQNVGAYGHEVASTLVRVGVLDRSDGSRRELDAASCGFGYRTSVFRGSERHVVLEATFRLARTTAAAPVAYAELARVLGVPQGSQPPASEVRAAVLALRRSKGMVLDAGDTDTHSAGSFFTNPVLPDADAARLPGDAPRWPAGPGGLVKVPAAWLVERAGFTRGYGHGAVRISSKHTLALTNRGGATTAELLALAGEVRAGVLAAFAVELAPEPILVGCALP